MPTAKKTETPSPKSTKTVEKKKPNIIEVLKEDLAKINIKKGKTAKDKSTKKPINKASVCGKIGFGLGIVSVGAWLVPLAGLPISIAGIVLNLLGLRVDKGRWFAVAGLTLSIIFLNFAMLYSFYGILMSMLYGV